MSDALRPLAVVGPTAVGKSALAMALARAAGRDDPPVELVSVDSMQVYRGMDIGTAKPSAADRAEVPHHLLDLLDPHEECSVAWFQGEARTALRRIAVRGCAAVAVGGTGLYHRAVVDRLEIPGQWPEVARELEREPDTEALHARLLQLDPVAAQRMEPTNRRRVIRALEVTIGSGRPFSSHGPGLDAHPPSEVVQVGLDLPRPEVAQRIARRLDEQMAAGFLDEVRRLDRRPEGWSRTASQALGYRELRGHLRDGRPLGECLEDIRRRTRRFAARQDRWFRRDPRITWFRADRPDLVEAVRSHWRTA